MFKLKFELLAFLLLLLMLTGCGGTYRYYSFKSRAEEAMRKKDFETAKDLYAAIYQHEKAAQKPDQEKICWAFYRLGVINELLGEKVLAKGYYWGDSMEEGFYAGQNQIEWFAETGWSWLDQGNPSRSLTQILGGYFVRQQGLATFARFRQTLDQGALPADEAIEGLLLLIVGVLLCVPGFITDFMGFMIVIPAIRKFVARMLINRLKANISAGNIRFSSGFAGPQTDQNFSQPGQADNQPSESSIENATIIEEIIDEKRQERTEK